MKVGDIVYRESDFKYGYIRPMQIVEKREYGYFAVKYIPTEEHLEAAIYPPSCLFTKEEAVRKAIDSLSRELNFHSESVVATQKRIAELKEKYGEASE